MTSDIFIKLSKQPGAAPSHEKPSIVEIVQPLVSFYAATEPATHANTIVKYEKRSLDNSSAQQKIETGLLSLDILYLSLQSFCSFFTLLFLL